MIRIFLIKNVPLPTVQQCLWGCSGRLFETTSVLEAMHDDKNNSSQTHREEAFLLS